MVDSVRMVMSDLHLHKLVWLVIVLLDVGFMILDDW